MANETITESDIWADIEAVCEKPLPMREKGDIDCKDMMAHYDCNTTNAREKMQLLAESGKWQFIEVRDYNNHNNRVKVIRRIVK